MTTTASGPLAGIRVVELGVWVAGPSAGAILADWGALEMGYDWDAIAGLKERKVIP